jgi:flavodoxin
VIYSSRTGNTKKVAEAVLSGLPEGTPILAAEDIHQTTEYDLIFMGYWVDKGTADSTAQEAMAKISGKLVAIFSTSGAYPDSHRAAASLKSGAACFGEDCTLLGAFICQGAVDPEFIEKAMRRPAHHHHAPSPERIQRWEDASTHPDATDLQKAVAFSRKTLEKAEEHLSLKGGKTIPSRLVVSRPAVPDRSTE